jgi:hypothetical protein
MTSKARRAALFEPGRGINGDYHVGAHGLNNIDGKVIDEAIVHQQAAPALHRLKHERMAELARIASWSRPRSMTTASPVSMSVAMAR